MKSTCTLTNDHSSDKKLSFIKACSDYAFLGVFVWSFVLSLLKVIIPFVVFAFVAEVDK